MSLNEYSRWVSKGESDLEAAKSSFKNEHYDWAVFQAQQAIEKSLKALQIAKKGRHERKHDVYELADSLGAPLKILDICQKVVDAQNHVVPRYPNMEKEPYSKQEAQERLQGAEEVIRWVKREKA